MVLVNLLTRQPVNLSTSEKHHKPGTEQYPADNKINRLNQENADALVNGHAAIVIRRGMAYRMGFADGSKMRFR